MKRLGFLFFCTLVLSWSVLAIAGNKKVVLFGIDGVRPDALKKASTPVMDSMIKTGAFTDTARTGAITLSGPGWSHLLTGVWTNKHKVTDNSFDDNRIDKYPHFFKRIKEVNPEVRTASIVHWEEINEFITSASDYTMTIENDLLVAMNAMQFLSGQMPIDPDVTFLHFDDVDGAGHSSGFSPESSGYIEAIEKIDVLLKGIISTIRARRNFHNEDWLFVFTTDHGGYGFWHGENEPECYTTFIIMNGKGVRRGRIQENHPRIVDIVPSIMKFLGIRPKRSWELDGRVIGMN